MNNDHPTPSAVRDAALEQAANLVELEYAPDAAQGRRLAQIAQHIRDLKKRKAEPEAVAPSAASMLRALLTELKPLTAYGVVGSRDVDQARYQRAIAEIEKCLGATPTPSAQAPAAEPGLAGSPPIAQGDANG